MINAIFKRIFCEAPAVGLLLLWAWVLLKCDDAMLSTLVPYCMGSLEMITWLWK